MAENKFVVFLTESIGPMQRQSLAEATAPALRVPVDKVVSLLSRPVGPLTRPSSESEANRILRVLAGAGVPVELRDAQGNPLAGSAAQAPNTGIAAHSQGQGNVSPAVASPAQGLPTANLQQPSTQDLGRTVFDDPKAPSITAVPSVPSFEQAASNFQEQQARLGKPAAGLSVNNNLANDSFDDVAFEDSDDDFGDVDIPAAVHNPWDSTLDEDEHERLLAERKAAEDRAASRAAAVLPSGQTLKRSFRIPILYKILLGTLVPLLATFAITFFLVDDRIVLAVEESLIKIGDNLAVTLASDLDEFLAQNNVSVDSDEAAIYFAKELSTIRHALHGTSGVHFTDAQGVRISSTWNSELTASKTFEGFGDAFSKLALRSLELGEDFVTQDHEDDDHIEHLFERTEKISGGNGNFYVIAVPLQGGVGTVQVIIAEGDIIRKSRRVTTPILYTEAIILFIAIIIALVIAFTLSRNLRRLAGTAERIALGDLEEPVPVRGNDEIRDLSEAFETMRQSLQAAIERISRREKGNR